MNEVKNIVVELHEDKKKIWNAMCETEHPGFWGFLTGWCTTAGVWLLVAYIIALFSKNEE